jgi:hypothetical protein
MTINDNISYFHHRGFGDLVINLYCRNLFHTEPKTDFLSEYLIELYELINVNETKYIVIDGINTYPAFINIKKSSLKQILKSMFQLYLSFKKIKKCYPENKIFVDHKRTLQDIYFNTKTLTPKITKNVYESHIQFYNELGFKKKIKTTQYRSESDTVRIFPYSSVSIKDFNTQILKKIVSSLEELEITYEVVYLDGDKVHDFQHDYTIIEKNFIELSSKLKRSKFNISCDSLPAHLSSFYDVKTLVLLPANNIYGLPLNSYLSNNFLTFKDIENNISTKLYQLIKKNFYESDGFIV